MQDAFRHASNDVAEAAQFYTQGMINLLNSWALTCRAVSNHALGTAERLNEQAQQAWDKTQPRMPAQPNQPPRQVG